MKVTSTKTAVVLALKGMAMGAANVVPGVSGGTLALITGIFEPLIQSLRSFNIQAIRLLLTGQFKKLAEHINLTFLISVGAGVGIAIISLAKIFKLVFASHPILIWSYFLGLIVASIFYVGQKIERWSPASFIAITLGTAVAVALTFLSHASENANPLYVFVCGAIAICCMILPGISGSYVLVLMGNYQLIMINAVSSLDIHILIPFALGAGVGLLAFTHFLGWLLKHYFNPTLALLTGFVIGSLGIIWPWKEEITQMFGEKEKVVGYNWNLPAFDSSLIWPVLLVLAGIATICITETLAQRKETVNDSAPAQT